MQSICTVVFVDSIKIRPTWDVLLEEPKPSPQKNPGPCVSNETCTLPGFRRGRRVE
jgi:hypothetical protein